MSPREIESIAAPPPHLALPDAGGLCGYRAEIIRVSVETRKGGDFALAIRVGDRAGELTLTPDACISLAESLIGAGAALLARGGPAEAGAAE